MSLFSGCCDNLVLIFTKSSHSVQLGKRLGWSQGVSSRLEPCECFLEYCCSSFILNARLLKEYCCPSLILNARLTRWRCRWSCCECAAVSTSLLILLMRSLSSLRWWWCNDYNHNRDDHDNHEPKVMKIWWLWSWSWGWGDRMITVMMVDYSLKP